MKYLKRINEITLSNHNHYIGKKFWNDNYGEKISFYKGFDVYYNPFEENKFTFFKNKLPVVLCFVDFKNDIPQVQSVEVDANNRGNEYALLMYEFLIEKYGSLLSDYLQTVFIKNVWLKLLTKHKMYKVTLTNFEKTPVLNKEEFEKAYDNSNNTVLMIVKN